MKTVKDFVLDRLSLADIADYLLAHCESVPHAQASAIKVRFRKYNRHTRRWGRGGGPAKTRNAIPESSVDAPAVRAEASASTGHRT